MMMMMMIVRMIISILSVSSSSYHHHHHHQHADQDAESISSQEDLVAASEEEIAEALRQSRALQEMHDHERMRRSAELEAYNQQVRQRELIAEGFYSNEVVRIGSSGRRRMFLSATPAPNDDD
eukprot:5817817-Karenia_brevis.AAC.1